MHSRRERKASVKPTCVLCKLEKKRVEPNFEEVLKTFFFLGQARIAKVRPKKKRKFLGTFSKFGFHCFFFFKFAERTRLCVVLFHRNFEAKNSKNGDQMPNRLFVAFTFFLFHFFVLPELC